MALEGLQLAAIVAVAIVGTWLVERWWVPRARPGLYFALGLPLGVELVPIPAPPEGAGRTATVAWEVRGSSVVYWVDPVRRAAPTGLHGRVRLVRLRDGRVHLDVTWSPPWAALGGVAWVALLGTVRGEGPLAATVATVLLVAVGLVYRQAALRAAAELRWAFTGGRGEGD